MALVDSLCVNICRSVVQVQSVERQVTWNHVALNSGGLEVAWLEEANKVIQNQLSTAQSVHAAVKMSVTCDDSSWIMRGRILQV